MKRKIDVQFFRMVGYFFSLFQIVLIFAVYRMYGIGKPYEGIYMAYRILVVNAGCLGIYYLLFGAGVLMKQIAADRKAGIDLNLKLNPEEEE